MTGIIIVDKPPNWTSQDVCSKLKGILKEKHIGHGGTLDPMATGVLPIFCGRATRAAQFSENSAKTYVAAIRTGITTDTQDITGRITSTSDEQISEEEFKNSLQYFTGEIYQLPPMYSAIKINGKKLYELARKGENADRKPRQVTIYSITYLGKNGCDFIVSINCSKGTYIRTLANDIGNFLGSGAVMSSLRRTMACGFSIEDAHTMDEIQTLSDNGRMDEIIKPVDSLFSAYPNTVIYGTKLKRCLNGNEFETALPDGLYRVYSDNGAFLMLGVVSERTMKTVKSFFDPEEISRGK